MDTMFDINSPIFMPISSDESHYVSSYARDDSHYTDDIVINQWMRSAHQAELVLRCSTCLLIFVVVSGVALYIRGFFSVEHRNSRLAIETEEDGAEDEKKAVLLDDMFSIESPRSRVRSVAEEVLSRTGRSRSRTSSGSSFTFAYCSSLDEDDGTHFDDNNDGKRENVDNEDTTSSASLPPSEIKLDTAHVNPKNRRARLEEWRKSKQNKSSSVYSTSCSGRFPSLSSHPSSPTAIRRRRSFPWRSGPGEKKPISSMSSVKNVSRSRSSASLPLNKQLNSNASVCSSKSNGYSSVTKPISSMSPVKKVSRSQSSTSLPLNNKLNSNTSVCSSTSNGYSSVKNPSTISPVKKVSRSQSSTSSPLNNKLNSNASVCSSTSNGYSSVKKPISSMSPVKKVSRSQSSTSLPLNNKLNSNTSVCSSTSNGYSSVKRRQAPKVNIKRGQQQSCSSKSLPKCRLPSLIKVTPINPSPLKTSPTSVHHLPSGGDDGDYMNLQNLVLELQEQLHSSHTQISSLEEKNRKLENSADVAKEEITTLRDENNLLQIDVQEFKSESDEYKRKLEECTVEHIATNARLNAVLREMGMTQEKNRQNFNDAKEKYEKDLERLTFELSVFKYKNEEFDISQEDEAVLRAKLDDREECIVKLEKQIMSDDRIRREMHNRIQELRGNIRVYVRIRPFLPTDGFGTGSGASTASGSVTTDISSVSSNSSMHLSPIGIMPDGQSLALSDNPSKSTMRQGPTKFKFDKVFDPCDGQDYVFKEVSDFVQSALDGYNVCLFSYGQTGSGKTHTMQGSGNGEMRGIIPRAVEQMLTQAAELQSQQKWEFHFRVSYLEIYNEELRDLLSSSSSPLAAADRNGISNRNHAFDKKTRQTKLSIRKGENGKIFVDGLSHVEIDSSNPKKGIEQLESIMTTAAKSRSVASTSMNATSSRSHSIFLFYLRGLNNETGEIVNGCLNLCDLAGSERLNRNGFHTADTKRRKETQSINKSLSCLGDVFNALANGSSHVPYRNSKLTFLLQDCLSGDGKALMFVNLSPTGESYNESLCSLRFAQRVNRVELGKATKNVNVSKKRVM